MKKYYSKNGKEVFDYLPETHLIKDINDPHFNKLVEIWNQYDSLKGSSKGKMKNIWICKPGENSNRGNGITVISSLEEIKSQVNIMNKNNNRTLIVQKYL